MAPGSSMGGQNLEEEKLHQSVTLTKDMLVGVFFSGGNYNAFRRRGATILTRSENVFSRDDENTFLF